MPLIAFELETCTIHIEGETAKDLAALIQMSPRLLEAAKNTVQAWENSNLASAIRELDRITSSIEGTDPSWQGDKKD